MIIHAGPTEYNPIGLSAGGALIAALEIMDADFDSAIPRFESWRPSQIL